MNPKTQLLVVAGCLCLAVPHAVARGQSPASASKDAPASLLTVPAEVPPDAARYSFYLGGNKVGVLARWRTGDSALHSYFEFNDRGRGPRTLSRITYDAAGLPRGLEVVGHDYLKSPVDERFAWDGEKARWSSRAENGARTLAGPAFYTSFSGDPSEFEALAAALLSSKTKSLPLLPEGEASIEKIAERTAEAGATRVPVLGYEISGLDFSPTALWLRGDGRLFAYGGGFSHLIEDGMEPAWPALEAAQKERDSSRGAALVKKAARKPQGALAFVHANLFDAVSATSRQGTTVLVEGSRIAEVGKDGTVAIPKDATVVDAGGRALLPGLWDMHVHLSGTDGVLHIAAGVTTVRDMANDIDEVGRLKRLYDTLGLVGPRVINAGFIDGRGPYQGPTKVFADTPEEAREDVEKYHSLGYEQIKVYSSLKPDLVALIAAEAHGRGMRISGHVPAFMTAEQFVKAGADEIQHINFIFLNFLFDEVKDTRTPSRFTAVAQHAAELDLDSARVRDFVRLLQGHKTVLDPTVNVFQSQFLARPGSMDPVYAPVASRLPVQVRRGFMGGGLPVPEGADRRYQDSAAALLRMVKLLYDAGVPLVAGTDSLAGFALQSELGEYVAAGIPAPKVLQLATLGAARVMKHDAESGSVEKGKLADLILVDGDPATNIADIRRVTSVVKDGVIFDPVALYSSLGVKAR